MSRVGGRVGVRVGVRVRVRVGLKTYSYVCATDHRWCAVSSDSAMSMIVLFSDEQR